AYTGMQLESAPLEARLANGTVALRLSVGLGSTFVVALKDVDVKGVELGQILVDFLCQPYAVTGPMDLTGEASLRANDPWRTVSGSGRFRIGPGKLVGRDVVGLVNEMLTLADVGSAVLISEQRMREDMTLHFA